MTARCITGNISTMTTFRKELIAYIYILKRNIVFEFKFPAQNVILFLQAF